MPRHDDAPRDLLFGLLALQNGLISRDQLVTAFALWNASDGRPRADVLADQGALAAPTGRWSTPWSKPTSKFTATPRRASTRST